MYGGTPAQLTQISQRSSPLVIKATLCNCTSVTQPVEMSHRAVCGLYALPGIRDTHSVTPSHPQMPAKEDRASLIHANAFRVEQVLRTAHFSRAWFILYVDANVQNIWPPHRLDINAKPKELYLAATNAIGPVMRPEAHVRSAIMKRIWKGLPRWSVIKRSTVFHTLLSWPQGH